MSSPPSLRDLYNPPPSSWSFLPAAAAPPSSSSAAAAASSSSKAYEWSYTSPPSPNSIFDLSPSLNLSEPSSIDVTLLLKTLVASAFLQYTSTAIAMPWEVGKMLLQVQWVPRDAGEMEEAEIEVVEEVEEVLSDDSSNENESYFADPNSSSGSRFPASRLADERGYVVRRSVLEESTRPQYIIPVGSADGVWGMIKRVGGFRSEGWLALWKGLLTSCITDVLSSSIQPLFHSLLQSIFAPALTPFQQPPLILPLTSHLLTGLLLSPLDLVRTRLIIQSSSARHRTYSGPIDALTQILRDEGGLRGVYLHPHLLLPTLLDNTLRPLVALSLPHLAASYLGHAHASADTHPIAWGFAEFVGSAVGLLATLPFETVRRRLQAQVRGSARPVRACVELRPAPYNGIVDALWHILTEERSDLPLKRKRRRTKGKGREGGEEKESADNGGWLRRTGIGQLYRGFGMRLGASAIVFLLRLVSGGEESESGWAEL